MKLVCIQDVKDSDDYVVFPLVKTYDFHMHPDGGIYQFEDNTCHALTTDWINYFIYEDKR